MKIGRPAYGGGFHLALKCSSVCLGAKAIRPPPTTFPSQHPPATLPRIPQHQPYKSTPHPGEPSPTVLIEISNPEVEWLWWGWVQTFTSGRSHLHTSSFGKVHHCHEESPSLSSIPWHTSPSRARLGSNGLSGKEWTCSAWSNLLSKSLASVEVFRVARAEVSPQRPYPGRAEICSHFSVGSFPVVSIPLEFNPPFQSWSDDSLPSSANTTSPAYRGMEIRVKENLSIKRLVC